MWVSTIAVATFACIAGVVLLSYAIEALRPQPMAPAGLRWAPDIAIQYANLDGLQMRYIKAGSGPVLLLLHTLRTQLDIFQRIIPVLARQCTVYACDFPGHGWSDIPEADCAPEDFYRWTGAFLDVLDIRDAAVAGISIGGTVALLLAARGNPRVASIIAINPYDYPPQGGIRMSSAMARLILGPAGAPILGATLMRLRTRFVSDRIMEGGVGSADAIPKDLKKELYDVGARRGHYRSFLRLLSHEQSWSAAREEYPRIRVPVTLVYGERDWAPSEQRERTRSLIPDVSLTVIDGGGHFLSLDRPQELAQVILQKSLHAHHR